MKLLNNNKILVVIPARGGSKGIPKKNIRLMNGKPLINYSIETALKSQYNIEVAVTTDDSEIAYLAEMYGAKVVKRTEELSTDEITLDPVIFHAVETIESLKGCMYDVVITIQPTSPLLKSTTLDNAIKTYYDNDFDTLISGTNSPHLAWGYEGNVLKPLYAERLNRQYLPKYFIETGSFVITKREYVKSSSRFGPNVSIFEVPAKESIDIDTAHDWWVAEKELNRKKILLVVDGYSEIGLGHIYRCLSLAYNLLDHDIQFGLSTKSDIGLEKIKSSYFSYFTYSNEAELFRFIKNNEVDIVINDILNTEYQYIKNLKQLNVKVVNFEDLGTGIELADVVINDLYEKSNEQANCYWGSEYYCVRDEFLITQPAPFNEEVKEVLVLFGGTDPSNLTRKVLEAVNRFNNNSVHYTFVLGLGYPEKELIKSDIEKYELNADVVCDVKQMTKYMQRADLAISSQGRTMYELALMEVPTILIAQHERETLHTFGELKNGFINLGIGNNLNIETIEATINWLNSCPQIRLQMKEKMKNLNLKQGTKNVLDLIFKDK